MRANIRGRTAWTARLLPIPLLWALPLALEAQYQYVVDNGAVIITRYNCSDSEVNIPSTIDGLPVTQIGQVAFSDCTRLTRVTIPDSVRVIDGAPVGNGAFWGCSNLSSVIIGTNVTTIGYFAFLGCASLTNVSLPSSVRLVQEYAFYGCTRLNAIAVDDLNPRLSSLDGVLFNKNRTTLVQYPGGKAGTYSIPDGVTNIASTAFSGVPNLTSVTIPSSVTSIKSGWIDGDGAFSNCSDLTGIYFKGNPPTALYVFDPGATAIVYYLPGATAWTTTFAGRPTQLWQPLMRSDDASFGVRTNRFGFTIDWVGNRVVIVEACTNLARPVWAPVATNILAGDSSYFANPGWTNYPLRFYRLRSPREQED